MPAAPPMRALAAPLLITGLLIALALISNNSEGGTYEALQRATGLAKGQAPAAQGAAAPAAQGAAGATAAGKQEQLQAEEKVHVMKCAKEITGDDTPRKLEPAVRDKVLECAKLFMPPVNTNELLRESAAKLVASATSAAEKADAQQLVTATTKDDGKAPEAAADKGDKKGAQSGGADKAKEEPHTGGAAEAPLAAPAAK